MYLTIRILHVLCGALWFGIAVMSALYLVPLAGDLGPDAAKVTASLRKRGYLVAVPVVAALTLISGSWLYWRYTAGFTPEVSRTHAGMSFGVGGALGILAFLTGSILISRSMMGATALAGQAAETADEAARARLLAEAGALRRRAAAAGKAVALLLLITMVLMTAALYV